MEEIYKTNKHKACPLERRGFLLIASLFILTTMIIIVSFYLSSINQEIKIAQIVDTAPKAYYLAEAGIQEAFWKLQNDAAFKDNFETNKNWTATFTRSDVLIPGGSYTVTIANTNLAQATITATSTISIRDTESQRVVQAGVFKALNDSPINGITMFGNGEIYSIGSNVNIVGGDLFANEDIDLNFFSSWSTDSDAKSVQDVDVSISSSLTAANIYDQTNPPIPEEIITPWIDFDSEDASSLKSQADQVYTSQAFKDLLRDFPITELDGIIYVTGNVDIKKGHTVTINGMLVADGSISTANGFSFEKTEASLTINKIGNEPSGIISKKNINIGGFSANLDVEGLIYAGGRMRIQDGIWESVDVTIEGGIIAQDIDILVSWEPITVIHNQVYINEALGTPLFSQVLFINHWEEEY
ncbi:hypothetical protein KKF64_00450 [Patescibacteria group bacterium]|nr:hypothetical protein [Patescibacteria group bacterium]